MVSQLKVNEIIKQSGSSISIGESGDTLNLSNPTSVTLNSTMKNTPAFFAKLTSDQSISNDTETKAALATEILDSDGKFDTSNYRFTPGVAGNYQFMINIVGDSQATANLYAVTVKLYKNGSSIAEQVDGVNFNFVDNYPRQAPVSFNVTDTSDADDYYEVYTAINDTSSTPQVFRYGSYFSAFLISTSA